MYGKKPENEGDFTPVSPEDRARAEAARREGLNRPARIEETLYGNRITVRYPLNDELMNVGLWWRFPHALIYILFTPVRIFTKRGK